MAWGVVTIGLAFLVVLILGYFNDHNDGTPA